MKEVKYIPGDLANPDGRIVKITSDALGLGKGNIEIGFSNGWHYTAHYKDFSDDILGIPLTPEILEKNGWSTQNGWFYYLDVRKGFISCIDIDFQHKSGSGKLLVKVNNENLLEIEFVHQLQHLLFGLGLSMNLKV